MQATPLLLKPEWPLPANVRSACSTRSGGASNAPYDSLNLGDHVGDELASVQANRAAFAQALGAKPVYLKQVHSWDVVSLEDQTPDGTVADACITHEKNLACTIMVADCLPVLFCNRQGTLVGAAHAGWRGLCGEGGIGVLEQTFKRFTAFDHTGRARGAIENVANDMLVWLGPCIGPTAFEVGSEVRQAFVNADARAEEHFKPLGNEKFLADLPALARQRLAKLGVQQVYGNDGNLEWCTVSKPSKFFSHRRDRVSGRFAASIWLT
jgi:polyphenol oxidase